MCSASGEILTQVRETIVTHLLLFTSCYTHDAVCERIVPGNSQYTNSFLAGLIMLLDMHLQVTTTHYTRPYTP